MGKGVDAVPMICPNLGMPVNVFVSVPVGASRFANSTGWHGLNSNTYPTS